MMQAAGGQFTDLLTQHWKENSTPPKWLWSLFQPVSTTPSAQVTQLQHSVSSNTAIIKDLKEEIAKLKSAVKQPGNRAANQGSSAKRARTSDKSTTASATDQKGEKCTYPGCKFRHSIDKCALRQKHEFRGGPASLSDGALHGIPRPQGYRPIVYH